MVLVSARWMSPAPDRKDRSMKITPRLAPVTWAALALVLLLVGLAPLSSFGRDAQRLWQEHGAGTPAVATMPAPNWVAIARAVKPAVVNVSVRGIRKDSDDDDALRQ